MAGSPGEERETRGPQRSGCKIGKKGRPKKILGKTRRGKRAGKHVCQRKAGKTMNTMNGIFNLSHRVLSDTEVKVLNKGLKFAPTNSLDKFNVYIDLQRFKRKLSLKKFFLKNPIEREIRQNSGPNPHTPLKNPSKFYPRHVVSNEMKVFENLVMNDIEKMSLKDKNHNLTKEEKIAIRSLQKDSSITIKPADKGGGIVILSKEMYDAEVLRTLGDKITYEKLKSDPIKDIKERINILLQEAGPALM